MSQFSRQYWNLITDTFSIILHGEIKVQEKTEIQSKNFPRSPEVFESKMLVQPLVELGKSQKSRCRLLTFSRSAVQFRPIPS